MLVQHVGADEPALRTREHEAVSTLARVVAHVQLELGEHLPREGERSTTRGRLGRAHQVDAVGAFSKRSMPGPQKRGRELVQRTVSERGRDVEAKQTLVELPRSRAERFATPGEPRFDPRRCVLLERGRRRVRRDP